MQQPYEDEPTASYRRQKSLAAAVISGMLLVVIILLAGFLLLRSSYFTLGTVVVEGNAYLTAEEVHQIADIPEKINIFRLHTAEIRQRLIKDLRVEEAAVTRQFPATIVIRVQERHPVAYIASGYGFLELDKQGMVLAAFKNLKQVQVPMITGYHLDHEYVGDSVQTPVLKPVLEYLAALDEVALQQISEINIQAPEQMVAYTTQAAHIRLGNSERMAEKAKFTNSILREMSDKKLRVEYIDVNYASPFIKMR